MKTYKTTGIIIKRHNFGEADRILTIYTREYGKIKVLAKGVRKTHSKLGGHLELFYVTEFLIHKGKNIDIVSGAELKKRYKNIDDKNLINYFFAISELLYFATEEREENIAIYNLTDEILSKISCLNVFVLFFLYELKLYNYLGYHPETGKCAMCGKNLVSKEVNFLFRVGGTICQECARKKSESIKISDNTYKIIRFAKNASVKNLLKIDYKNDVMGELEHVIRQMRYEIIERELKSLN
jgi:DNA repair protein RecO (recombination protein O)